MTKLFKNSKQILAFVFAFAVLAVSLFTGGINISADACDVSKIDYWDGTKASEFAGGDGSESKPFIIKTAEQLAYACLGQTATGSTGKYYKVDDSVKVFVMQPENVVDLETLIGLDSAEAVKDYLTGLSGVKNWMTQFNSQSFNGNFDGNGATVYGLYADGVAASKEDVGLFPQYDGGSKDGNGNVIANTCKNIAVKNSYFNSKRRVGAISGASYSTGYGAKIDGIIHYDTIAVVNCYITAIGNANYFNEQAIIADGGGVDVSTFNNCLVKGNYAYNTEQGKNMGVVAAANSNGKNNSAGELVKPKMSNSIILGSDPFRKDYYNSVVFQYDTVDGKQVRTFFDNVITDQPAGKITAINPAGWGSATSTAEYTEAMVKQITASGFDFQAEATTLDWENIWFMGENGPELRAFHGEITITQTATTHVWECADCGLKSYGGVADHEWVSEDGQAYVCSVCGYNCKHDSLTTYDDPGNCVVDPGTYTECNYCDYVSVFKNDDAPGHTFTYVEADPGDCETNGHAEYWECSVCNNKFATDDIKAPMDTAVTDTDLDTGLGKHPHATNDDGTIFVGKDASGHWYVCSIDKGRLDYDSNVLAEGEVVEHTYSDAVCIDCGYECVEHDFKSTGKVAVVGDCYTDEELEIKCNICGYKDTVVSVKAGHSIVKVEEVQATDRMEGTKAHYSCGDCKSIFGDAEGKNAITKTSLIIPKVLPAEYQNTINADQSTKSPSTSDNFASVLAVAALAGAVLVITHKVSK